MNYPVKLSPAATRFLSQLHPENKRLIRLALKALSENPYCGKQLQEELTGFWSYKPKRFRIIYRMDDRERIVYVFFIGHRKDVYELFADYLKTKHPSDRQ